MKRYKKELRLSSFKNLIVSIFVIGYKNIGESVVVLFRDSKETGEDIIFSIVIDCYKTKDLFLTKKILDDHHVTSIDMVCWTHPHADHSPGIDEIFEGYFNQDMWLFIPKFYFGNLQKDLLKTESEFTQEVYDHLNKIINKTKDGYKVRKTIVGEGDMTNHYPIKLSADDGGTRDMDFYFLTPYSGLIDKYAIKGHELSRPNDLSISFVMSLDGYDFFFGGDVEDNHAEHIDESIIRDMRWIKVPHHCSGGCSTIYEHLGPQFNYAASTVFTSAGLPNEDVQNRYSEKGGRLFMTQLRSNDTINKDYGVIEFDYKFRETDIVVDIHTFGNANEYVKVI